jgi:hypothetical protein
LDILHEFFRGADGEATQARLNGDVDEMAKIQREQRIKTVNGGSDDMGCITACIRRKDAAIEDLPGERENRLGNFQQGQGREQFQSFSRHDCIAHTRFIEDNLRSEQFVRPPGNFPTNRAWSADAPFAQHRATSGPPDSWGWLFQRRFAWISGGDLKFDIAYAWNISGAVGDCKNWNWF